MSFPGSEHRYLKFISAFCEVAEKVSGRRRRRDDTVGGKVIIQVFVWFPRCIQIYLRAGRHCNSNYYGTFNTPEFTLIYYFMQQPDTIFDRLFRPDNALIDLLMSDKGSVLLDQEILEMREEMGH